MKVISSITSNCFQIVVSRYWLTKFWNGFCFLHTRLNSLTIEPFFKDKDDHIESAILDAKSEIRYQRLKKPWGRVFSVTQLSCIKIETFFKYKDGHFEF